MSLLTNLISYWKMDEASGTRVDSQGTNDLPVLFGSLGSAAGIINDAASFLRANSFSFLSIPSNSSLQTGDIDFTFSLWIYINDANANVIFTKIGEYGMSIGVWTVENGAASVSLGSLSTNTWYHIVAWHDSVNNEIGVTINNGSPTTTSYSGGITAGSGEFDIGNDNTASRGWGGLVDEMGFWKRMLTSQERTDLYNGGAGLAYPFSSPPPAGAFAFIGSFL